MPITRIRRARLDVLTRGGHDGSNEHARCFAADSKTSGASEPDTAPYANHRAHVGASERTCAQVHSYKYRSPPSSTFERWFLERWWTHVVEKWCPTWVAPNALTFGGLMFVIATYWLIWAMSPMLTHTAPTWTYVLGALCLFAYQTADGIDGKQARRTKSGSPLGEVVDHGCDAVCTCVYGVVFADLLAAGVSTDEGKILAIAIMTGARVFFTVDTISSTYTGLLPVNTLFDVQEMQICLQLSMLVFAYVGSDVMNSVQIGIPLIGNRGAVRTFFDVAAIFGATQRARTFYRTVTAKDTPPHWPKYRSPTRIAIFCVSQELFHGFCLYHAPNLPLAHATSMFLFAEAEMSIMRIRVSDPDWPLFNWLNLAIVSLTTCVPAGNMFLGGILLGATLFILVHRSATLCAQVTGCLGLHPNIFVLRPRQGA
ncbi:CDP-alcohol phosphatidyltransferase [Ostreococcus tauri]|nr:CDP-alcohol phosphatidyltransferase [Ostreococcus tauri]CEF97354.1 CDP-alcohol phosphatidyltransferase [Ostreococcus tauri]|eukprot:XP_022838647.1 CDP-alcohol phosphatidyltransferase [Ostreococcus tauri]